MRIFGITYFDFFKIKLNIIKCKSGYTIEFENLLEYFYFIYNYLVNQSKYWFETFM